MNDPSAANLNLGPWIISGVALVQVWVIAAWRHLRRPKLEWYESHNIEIGYSSFGPTLALLGTLATRHREYFVRSISVKITRKADNLSRSFQWHSFRSHKIDFRPDAPLESETVSSFLLSPQQPFKFSIFFQDAALVADLNQKVSTIVTAWNAFLAACGAVDVAGADLERAWAEFVKTPGPLEAFAALDRSLYWTSGEYLLEVQITGANGKAQTVRRCSFVLASEDEENLRQNVVAIQRFLCDVRLVTHFNFARPKYRPA